MTAERVIRGYGVSERLLTFAIVFGDLVHSASQVQIWLRFYFNFICIRCRFINLLISIVNSEVFHGGDRTKAPSLLLASTLQISQLIVLLSSHVFEV